MSNLSDAEWLAEVERKAERYGADRERRRIRRALGLPMFTLRVAIRDGVGIRSQLLRETLAEVDAATRAKKGRRK